MKLTEKERDWTRKAIEAGHTKIEIKKKLKDTGYPAEKILEIFDYMDEIEQEYIISEAPEPPKKAAETFEKNVRKFLQGNENELSWSEKRDVKKFLKNVTKYTETMKVVMKAIKAEVDTINKRFGVGSKDTAKEIETLRRDMIDRVIDAKDILIIEHPRTGKTIEKKEELSDLTFDELMDIMEDNIKELEVNINGRITEE